VELVRLQAAIFARWLYEELSPNEPAPLSAAVAAVPQRQYGGTVCESSADGNPIFDVMFVSQRLWRLFDNGRCKSQAAHLGRPVRSRHGCTRIGGRVMRDLSRSTAPFEVQKDPTGLAFAIADLVLVGCWSALHDFHMVIRLDHGSEDEEYEEVVEFRTHLRPRSRWIMWRSAEAVFMQPILGRKRKFASVAAALDSLLPTRRVVAKTVNPSATERARRLPRM